MKNRHDETLDLLARREPLTDADWEILVQTRADRLRSTMRDMTLRQLGEVQFLQDYFNPHSLERDLATLTSIGKWGLTTRGIFPNESNLAAFAHVEFGRNTPTGPATSAVHKFWGLTRDKEWLMIEVKTSLTKEPYKDRTETVQRAQVLTVATAKTVAEMCRFCNRTPMQIFHRFSEVVKQHASHRRWLYEQAQTLEAQLDAENQLLRVISDRSAPKRFG